MEKSAKILSIIFIIMLVLNVLSNQVFTKHSAEASELMTREEAKSFEGKLAADSDRTLLVREDGTIAATNYHNYDDVIDWKAIKFIATGWHHTVGLKEDGTAIAVRGNEYGETDVESWTDLVQVAAGDWHTVGLKNDGTVVATGSNRYSQINTYWEDIVEISAGSSHTVGLKEDGTVVATGQYNSRKIDVHDWQGIVSVSAGFDHTVGLKADGTVVAVGDNNYGQLNVEEWKDIVSISADESYTVGLKADGTVVATGSNYSGKSNVSDWKNIIAIEAGAIHTVGLKADGSLVATGDNWNGQTDVDGWQDLIAVAPTWGQFTVGLKSDGKVIGTGVNHSGQLNLENWQDIVAISGGFGHTVGLKEDGTVLAVGAKENDKGQTDVSDWHDITAISAGSDYTVGLKSDGTVVATGDNYYGQTDVSDWTDIVEVSAGMSHTLGLKADGTVVGAGYEGHGMLNVEEWKDIIAISAGTNYTVGLKADGTLVTAGTNDYGELNVGSWTDIVAIQAGNANTIGLKSDGTVVGTGGFWGNQSDVHEWQDIVKIYGGSSTIGLKKDGALEAIGQNAAGELNVGGPLNYFNIDILSSLSSSKSVARAGDSIQISVTFAKPMKSGVKIFLKGATKTGPSVMNELQGSDGKIFTYSFTVPEGTDGSIHFQLTDLVDRNGIPHSDQHANNLLMIDGDAPKLFGTQDIFVNVNETFHLLKGISAYDSVDGFLTSQIKVEGSVDTTKMGSYKLAYTVMDQSQHSSTKERTIHVVDEVKPELHGLEDMIIKVGENFDPMEGVTASDNADGDVTHKVELTNQVDTLQPGTYTLVYTVADLAGNVTALERRITVVDDVGPVFKGTDHAEIRWNSSFDPKEGVTAKDNVDGEVTDKIEISGIVDVSKPGKYKLVYSVSDTAGNVSTTERHIMVIDDVKPIISGVADIKIPKSTDFDPNKGITAMDNVDGDLTESMIIKGEVKTFLSGNYVLVYEVTDSSGNTTSVERTVTILKAGWVLEGGVWFYYKVDGEKQTGWLNNGGKWYYLDGTGAMKTGWISSGGKWYYLDGTGAMKTGWISNGGKWYFLDGTGSMKTGWIKSGNQWYYLDKSGAMQTGWLLEAGKWYYLNPNGEMQTDWKEINGKWYYFYSNGKMAANTTINGYRLGNDGSWKK